MDIALKVREIIAEQAMLDVADVRPEHTLADLGVDSMAVVEAIFVIEETFDISVPFNANQPEDSDFDISTVARIAEGVQRLVDQKP
ncbi:acyl carrier protein [Aestuariicoccus sp. MJ-SS9]|uniref:acyl carrier protein n=1 Tax=Aestuariicoccus sp. MJ-SS9 TaxID=3079855 RepID=UPI00290C0EC2|nr:acyl carrier protein [Aestuariicoccus sp. MJ-SS9]MDU8911569.1 acyl carrier protein [Aestuariicoccus sp. MJ-SS9]